MASVLNDYTRLWPDGKFQISDFKFQIEEAPEGHEQRDMHGLFQSEI